MLMDDDIDVGRKARMLRRVITTCQDGFTAIEVIYVVLVSYTIRELFPSFILHYWL